jgi:mannose-1-phosphate guanylyltransferase/phosphomannomutase
MVPVLNRPVMEYSVELLKNHGVNTTAVTRQYLPPKIIEHFGDGAECGVHMDYFTEKTPLGTAGSVRAAKAMLDETFAVISGDALTDIDLAKAHEFHKSSGADVTIELKKVDMPGEYGIVLMGMDGRIERFLEKPAMGEVFSDLANTGIYIIEPGILDLIEADKELDFSKHIFPMLLEKGKKLFGYEAHGYWCDIGDVAQYMQANRDALDGRCKIAIRAYEEGGGIWAENGARVSSRCVIKPPCYIGADAQIDGGVALEPYSVIGRGVKLEGDCSIKRAVIWDGARIRRGAQLRGALICENAQIKENASVFENAVIGSASEVGASSMTNGGVLVWPNKVIEPYSAVNENIVWNDGRKKKLLCPAGMEGKADTELTPQVCAKLGCAAAAAYALPLDALAIGSDGSANAAIAKQAISAGLMSQGKDVYDIGHATIPMFRYGLKQLALSGGAYIYESAEGVVTVKLMDDSGNDLNTAAWRKVSADFERGAFTGAPQPGMIMMRREVSSFYKAALLRSVDRTAMRQNPYRAVIFGDGASERILYEVLSLCGWDAVITSAADARTQLVKLKGDIGFLISKNGERLVIFNNEGSKLDEMAMTALMVKTLILLGRRTIALPVDVPEAIEQLAVKAGVEFVRTSSRNSDWMRSSGSGEIFFDGVLAALSIAQAASKTTLEQLISELPETSIKEQRTSCSWREIGRILRTLVETEHSMQRQLIDGIRVKHDAGWVLVRPRHSAPGFKIVCESMNEEYAQELVDMYARKIESIKKNDQK